MLYYDRIDTSENIDLNKTSASKVFVICHYWHFLDGIFKFQVDVFNVCHDVLMMSMNMSICCIIHESSKSKA